MLQHKIMHVLIVALTAHVITARVMCPSHPNCVCGGTFAIELNCNIDGHTVKIDLLPNTYMNIKCENSTSLDYSKLPKCANEMNNFKSVSFKDCPLPTTSFKQILNQIGVSKTMSLIFQNSKPLLGYFNRSHFAGLNDLTKLLLSVNGNTNLPDNLFMDINNITWLNIRCNNINLSEELFKPLERLETLEISHNHMTNVSSNLFSHLSLLRKLSLWQSNVTWFSKDFFTGVDVLEELDLSSNGLHELPTSIFRPLTKLKKLTLFSNKFSTIPRDLFLTNSKLETVVILNNDVKIKSLPKTLLSNLINLKQVYVQRSGIEVVPNDVFVNSSFITNISLAYNDITKLPESTFNDQINLLELDLSHNNLCLIERKLFSSLVELEKLDLSYNSIEELSRDTFTPLISLVYLNMEHNNLKRVSANLFNVNKQRMWISLAYNSLNFESLNFCHDEWVVTKVSPLALIRNLKMLNLSHNKFRHTFEDWFTNGHENLDISYNSIQYLWEEQPQILVTKQDSKSDYAELIIESYKQVSVLNNPITCSCENFFFIRHLKCILNWEGIGDPFKQCSKLKFLACSKNFLIIIILLVVGIKGFLVFLYLRWPTIKLIIKRNMFMLAHNNLTSKSTVVFVLYCDDDEEFVLKELLPKLKDNKQIKCQQINVGANCEKKLYCNIMHKIKKNELALIVFSPNYLMAAYKDVNIKKIRGEMLQKRNTIYVYADIGPENSVYAFLKEQRDKRTTILWSDPNFWNKLNFSLSKSMKRKVRFSADTSICSEAVTSNVTCEKKITSPPEYLQEQPKIIVEGSTPR